ncbi:MAG: hypothetical protein ACK4QL_02685 [Pseudanabaenaceae cyanobacterium]
MQEIIRICQDVDALRELVAARWGIVKGRGNYWLPIICSLRGSVFAEVIGQTPTGKYIQPVDLTDQQRQPLYRFGFQLLDYLNAPPAVYLLQFGWEGQGHLLFDRLLPFPAQPAIASVGVQVPDLFTCHWLCLTEQPIPEIVTYPPAPLSE